jgi:hypothetical protein
MGWRNRGEVGGAVVFTELLLAGCYSQPTYRKGFCAFFTKPEVCVSTVVVFILPMSETNPRTMHRGECGRHNELDVVFC